MLAATLIHEITIEKVTPAKDSIGQVTPVWNELFKVKATKKCITGNENFATDGSYNYGVIQWLFRYDSRLDYDCRIVYNNQVYEIRDIRIVDRRKSWMVTTFRNQDNAN